KTQMSMQSAFSGSSSAVSIIQTPPTLNKKNSKEIPTKDIEHTDEISDNKCWRIMNISNDLETMMVTFNEVYSSRIFLRCMMFLVTVTSNLYWIIHTLSTVELFFLQPFIAAAGQVLPFFILCRKGDGVYNQFMKINTCVKNLQARLDLSLRGHCILQATSHRLDARPALIGIGSVGNLN
ncbi:unnamed protein product, partial [Meganyctiphanes norvegica]